MKKVLVLAVLAIGAIACTQQKASAWVNTRFGIGANLDWQSGGNSLLWGAWRSAQPGGGEPPGLFQNHPNKQRYYGAPYPTPGFAPPPAVVPPPPGAAPAPGLPVMMPYPFGPIFDPTATAQMPYAMPYAMPYQPYQYATYARPLYYYPTPYYYGR